MTEQDKKYLEKEFEAGAKIFMDLHNRVEILEKIVFAEPQKLVNVDQRVRPMLAKEWQKEKPSKPCYFIHRYNRKDNKPSLFEAVMDGGVLVVANIQDDEFVGTMEDFADGDFFIIEKY